jgi:hypothetical protein
MKRTLIFLVVLAMIPIFLGILCPCAMAAPSEQLVFQKAVCEGCCPEMNASPECNSAITSAQTLLVSSLTELFKVPNVLKALHPDESRDIAINRRALVPAGDEPSPGFVQPLYLTLQTFRI